MPETAPTAITAPLIDAIAALPVRPLNTGEIRKSLPDIGRFTLVRWTRDLQRNLDAIVAAVADAEHSPLTEAGIDAVERALWRLSAGRKSLLAVAYLGLGVPTVHPVKLAKGDSVPRGLRFDPRWEDLENKLAGLQPARPVAAELAEVLSELHEHPAIVLRNEITHSLGPITEAPELCWLEIVELDENQEIGRDARFMWPNGLPVGKDIRPQTLWDYVVAQVKEAFEILARAADKLAALLASGAAYLERPQLIYLDARTGRASMADPR
jgi:hypothetical protein